MTKEEILDKIKEKPKKALMLIHWNSNGNARSPQTMIYSGHDDSIIYGVQPRSSGTMRLGWNQLQWVTRINFMKPDIITKSYLTYAEKHPFDDERHVGIEMELISKLDTQEMSTRLAEAGLEGYVHTKTDGSVSTTRAYPHNHELAILVKEKELVKVIKKVCAILHGTSNVNKSCGLHVHLDMRKRNLNLAYANLFSCQPLLYAMCPATRLTNNYCKPTTSYRKVEDAMNGSDRYLGINASAFHKHKTIEIRIHSGTINPNKIINWVKLLIQVADKPETNTEAVAVWRNYKEMKSAIGLRGILEKYVASRLEEFAEDHEASSLKLSA